MPRLQRSEPRLPRVEMAVEKKASLASKKRMCLVAISAGEHPMKIAIVDESQFRRSQTS
jgi:hypothetical protein